MNHFCHRGEYIKGNSWGRRGLIIRCMCFGCVFIHVPEVQLCVREYGGQPVVRGYHVKKEKRFLAVTCNIENRKITYGTDLCM